MSSILNNTVLCVASAGGHWVQLRRLAPALDGFKVVYLSTDPGYENEVKPARFYSVNDANRWDKIGLVKMGLRICWLLIRIRPKVIISTGAAPGYFALRMGKILRANTVWIDSLANVDKMSLTGLMVAKYADLWLTQWEHLSQPDGPYFVGSVL
jgi:UDP-N-acetylglucosamine:LPS N-acetylglucosamine transferase